jgi:hypothetical protein
LEGRYAVGGKERVQRVCKQYFDGFHFLLKLADGKLGKIDTHKHYVAYPFVNLQSSGAHARFRRRQDFSFQLFLFRYKCDCYPGYRLTAGDEKNGFSGSIPHKCRAIGRLLPPLPSYTFPLAAVNQLNI